MVRQAPLHLLHDGAGNQPLNLQNANWKAPQAEPDLLRSFAAGQHLSAYFADLKPAREGSPSSQQPNCSYYSQFVDESLA